MHRAELSHVMHIPRDRTKHWGYRIHRAPARPRVPDKWFLTLGETLSAAAEALAARKDLLPEERERVARMQSVARRYEAYLNERGADPATPKRVELASSAARAADDYDAPVSGVEDGDLLPCSSAVCAAGEVLVCWPSC
jgi:hypothetical protein